MRITGGEARGRRLSVPRSSRVRPTSDKVRGAIFDILEAREGIRGDRILDLFAGSGALGVDALSRGAAHVEFVDESQACLSTVRQNLERAGFLERATLRRGALPGAIERIDVDAFEGAFVDPPYRRGLCEATLERLAAPGPLRRGAWVVVEHDRDEPLADRYGRLSSRGEWRYGSTRVRLYRMEEA